MDPHRSAVEAHVFWLPAMSPFVVPITRAPPEFVAVLTFPELTNDEPTSPGPAHVALGAAGRVFQLALLDGRTDLPLAVLLPLDPDLPARLHAVGRLWRRLRRGAADPPGTLPPQRRARLVSTLRALDGRMAGASTRDIAAALFGPERIPAGPEWKAHDLRSRAKRLIASGFALMNGGYRELLRPQHSRRDD